jgi:hypothetical protein
MGVGGQRHTLAALPLEMKRGTNCRGGWVGLRAGLDGCRISRPPTGIKSPDHPARSESLYRLRYPGTQSCTSTVLCYRASLLSYCIY